MSDDLNPFGGSFTAQETGEFLAKMALPFHNRTSADETETPTVSYYFKPQTKYPPRIQLLYGNWPVRNRRAAGISKQPCLYKRPVGPIERDEMKGCGRLMANQYEAAELGRMIFRHMEDGFTDEQIQALLDAVLPACTPEFSQHEPVASIRQRFETTPLPQ